MEQGVKLVGYITTLEASEKWGISDRRVRVLCGNGRIPGVAKDGKSYKIPLDAQKPSDKRLRNPAMADVTRYLKWDNTVVGVINKNNAVAFIFHQRIDMVGDSVDTPEGHNVKRYGVH